MYDITLTQVIEIVDQLSIWDRVAVLRYLEIRTPRRERVTLESIKMEHARRLASGAFAQAENLADRWAKPDLNLTDDEWRTQIKDFANAWKQEIDDLGII